MFHYRRRYGRRSLRNLQPVCDYWPSRRAVRCELIYQVNLLSYLNSDVGCVIRCHRFFDALLAALTYV